MLYINHVGRFVKRRRIELGLGIPEFADRTYNDCNAIYLLEEERLPQNVGVPAMLGSSNSAYNISVDICPPSDTELFSTSLDRQISFAKQRAYDIITSTGMTKEWKVINYVMAEIQEEHYRFADQSSKVNVDFRHEARGLQITEEYVSRLVALAKIAVGV